MSRNVAIISRNPDARWITFCVLFERANLRSSLSSKKGSAARRTCVKKCPNENNALGIGKIAEGFAIFDVLCFAISLRDLFSFPVYPIIQHSKGMLINISRQQRSYAATNIAYVEFCL